MSELSEVGRFVPDAVENAPILRLQHGNLTIEGYSRAAVQTYWRIPELKLGFDLGAHPWSFMNTPNWFVSHFHLDHAAALPVYVARRRMMKMAPPRIYVAQQAVSLVERLLRLWERLDRGRMRCELVGLEPGDEVELTRHLVVSAFSTSHTVPSLGFLVWERRKKLKPEYQGLPGEELARLRRSGVEITQELRIPLVAYLGDTSPRGLDAHPAIYEAKILILEVTFLAPDHRKEIIHKYGHIHLDDIVERADRFNNELIIGAHVSTRYHRDRAERLIQRRVPETLRDRFRLWL